VSKSQRLRKILLTKRAEEDLEFWVKSGEKKTLAKINDLIADCRVNPTTGLGAPEQLRFQDFPTYSRRINRNHRLVYQIDGEYLIIISARYHYEK
jgi:toxin YoeB